MTTRPLAALIAAAALAGVSAGAAAAQTPAQPAAQMPAPASAHVMLKGPKGEDLGHVMLTAAPKGVLLRVEAKGLTPGWHGLHFHEKAACTNADFTSAGGHTHGGGDRVHGLLNPKANETGDLPNVYAGADGLARGEAFTGLTTLAALKDADGSAIVVHAAADDHASQPIGGAGARVACGEIK